MQDRPDLFAADVVVIADTGNVAVGQPTVTTRSAGIANVVVHVETLEGELHSGMYGGSAPDAIAALVQMLSTLRDHGGNTVVDGLDTAQDWDGAQYPEQQFRKDAGVLDGVRLTGSGSVADAVWARPALTILGIDAPPVIGSAAAIQPRASARLNLRVPPAWILSGPGRARRPLEGAAPWGAHVRVERESSVPRPGADVGRDTRRCRRHWRRVRPSARRGGQGGTIPLCNVLAEQFPGAEIVLMGVEEPQALIHAPNESVDPSEIEKPRRRRGPVPAGPRRTGRVNGAGLDGQVAAQLGDMTVARTLYCATSILPSSSTRNVERMTPWTTLPYIFFSPNAPHAVSVAFSGSDSSGKVRPSLSRNFASLAGLSGEIPTTSRPAPLSSSRLSRKSHACLVQPGVLAAG